MPKVSVIIPCYNQGQFLDEAVQSVLNQRYTDIEIIIVNDGSTDVETIEQCESYEHPKITLLTTTNNGLAAARNNGIKRAEGKYILPLDADDKIGPDYLIEAVSVLEENPEIGIVYSRAQLFGAVETEWQLPPYSIEEILKNNVIFCSALFYRKDWELVGGYDPGMIYGWEDYDFWLSLIERSRKVFQLPTIHFYYRIAPDSMVRSKKRWQKIEMFKRIYKRHAEFIGDNIEVWIDTILESNEPTLTSRLYVNSGEGINDKESIEQAISLQTNVAVFDFQRFSSRKEIRFDPVDYPVCIEIFSIEFLGDETLSFNLGNINSNACLREKNLYMFDTDDPQIYIPITEHKLSYFSQLKINFHIHSVKEQALRYIIEYLSKKRETDAKKAGLIKRMFK